MRWVRWYYNPQFTDERCQSRRLWQVQCSNPHCEPDHTPHCLPHTMAIYMALPSFSMEINLSARQGEKSSSAPPLYSLFLSNLHLNRANRTAVTPIISQWHDLLQPGLSLHPWWIRQTASSTQPTSETQIRQLSQAFLNYLLFASLPPGTLLLHPHPPHCWLLIIHGSGQMLPTPISNSLPIITAISSPSWRFCCLKPSASQNLQQYPLESRSQWLFVESTFFLNIW